MKRLWTIGICLVLLLSSGFVIRNEGKDVQNQPTSKPIMEPQSVYWSEDFEGYTVGQPIIGGGIAATPPSGKPLGSIYPVLTTGSVCTHIQSVEYYGPAGVNGGGITSALLGGWFIRPTGQRIDLIVMTSPTWEPVIQVSMWDTGQLVHWPGGIGEIIPGITWSPGSWHELWVEYDEISQTYSVWWDGANYVPDSDFITTATDIDGFTWLLDGSGEAYIDNCYHWDFNVPFGPVYNLDTGKYYDYIQLAINDPDTLDDHTITVDAGTYYENVVVDKNISIIGEDKNTTIIDGNLSQFGDVIKITTDWVNISGFRIQNAGENEGNRDAGIKIDDADHCHIFDNNVINNEWLGIHTCFGSRYNLIENNNCSYNEYGAYIETDWNTVINNTFFNNSKGFHAWGRYNEISYNQINHNIFGIVLWPASDNTITYNEILENDYGVHTTGGANNILHHNNFIGNNISAHDVGSNKWNDSYPSGGNYWDDYTGVDFNSTPAQNVPPPDGIGDTPYVFDFNQDNYPLMSPMIVNTRPQIEISYPNGGEIWQGGSSQMIYWNMSDSQDPNVNLTVELYYSTTGSSGPWTYIDNADGSETYNWGTIPLIDSTNCYILANVTDTGLLSYEDVNNQPFTIDSTAPAPATNVYAELNGTGVSVYWDASPSPDVDHYEVYWIMNKWDPTGDIYANFFNAGDNTTVYHANIGMENANSYVYQVRTFDEAGHETRTVIQAAKWGSTQAVLAREPDWFLLGCALPQTNTSVEHVIQSIMPNVDRVDLYRNGQWLHWASYWPPSLNTLNDIYTDEGFWAHLNGNDRLAIAGYVEDKAISLYEGWNLVAYPFAQRTMTSADIMTHLSVYCIGYNGMLVEDLTTPAPYHVKTPSGTEIISHNMGIWIHVTSDTVWTVANY